MTASNDVALSIHFHTALAARDHLLLHGIVAAAAEIVPGSDIRVDRLEHQAAGASVHLLASTARYIEPIQPFFSYRVWESDWPANLVEDKLLAQLHHLLQPELLRALPWLGDRVKEIVLGPITWVPGFSSGRGIQNFLSSLDQRQYPAVVVNTMLRRGLLDRTFFLNLCSSYPHRRSEVVFAASLVGVQLSAEGVPLSTEPDNTREALTFSAIVSRFLQEAGHPTQPEAADTLRAQTFTALLTQNVPPLPEDAQSLRDVLREGEKGCLVYHGSLSRRVRDVLNGLRMDNHPIMPLPMHTIEAALRDGQSRKVFHALQQDFFVQQNLYARKNAIHTRDLFFGREALLTRVSSSLASGDAVLLAGLRKSGKSSFLNILRQHMVKHPWCHVDLQRYASNTTDWPLRVARELVEAIDRWGREEFPRHWPADLPGVPALSALAEALGARRRWLRSQGRAVRPVLVWDEVERVLPRPGDEARARCLVEAGAFRAAAQGQDGWLTMLVADLRPHLTQWNTLPSGQTNPFYEFFQVVPLPLFSQHETSEMIREIGAMMGIRHVSEDFLGLLQDFTGGHPSFVRLIAAAAAEHREDSEALRLPALKQAINRLHRQNEIGNFFRQNIWEPMTTAEQAAVRWLSASERARPLDEAADVLARDIPTWASLVRQGIVVETAQDERRLARLSMAGFRDWLEEQALLVQLRASG